MTTHDLPQRQAGMSLVELMVGMLIGLIGIIIITHIYVTNEQQKRATTASGGAQTNGAIALFAIERDLRQAGFGLNHSRALTCNCNPGANMGCSAVQYFFGGSYSFPPAGSVVGARNGLTIYPVIITDAPNKPDTLSIFYGSDRERVLATQMTFAMANSGSDIQVDGTSGFDAGDLIVLQNGATCAMVRVTGTTADAIQHNGGSFNPGGGGSLPAFPQGSFIFNLGQAPAWRSYGVAYDTTDPTINKGVLQLTDNFRVLTAGAVSEDIMTNIYDLQAQYGKDTDGDGDIDLWTKQLPTVAGSNFTPAELMQIKAVRVAVLARNEEWVKPAVPGTCDATTAANRPTWGGTANLPFPTFDAPGALPSCYKFRVLETVVPLRNMIWRIE